MAHPHDSLDLFRRAGQQYGLWKDAEIRQPVTLVGFQLFLRRDQADVSHDCAEFLKDAGVHERSVWPAAFQGAGSREGSASLHKRQTAVTLARALNGNSQYPPASLRVAGEANSQGAVGRAINLSSLSMDVPASEGAPLAAPGNGRDEPIVIGDFFQFNIRGNRSFASIPR
jgi:hypothetical protein